MAIAQIGVQPKQEESSWDKISKVMGFVTSAANIAGNTDKLLSGAPSTDVQKATSLPDNVLTRRRFGSVV